MGNDAIACMRAHRVRPLTSADPFSNNCMMPIHEKVIGFKSLINTHQGQSVAILHTSLHCPHEMPTYGKRKICKEQIFNAHDFFFYGAIILHGLGSDILLDTISKPWNLNISREELPS